MKIQENIIPNESLSPALNFTVTIVFSNAEVYSQFLKPSILLYKGFVLLGGMLDIM